MISAMEVEAAVVTTTTTMKRRGVGRETEVVMISGTAPTTTKTM